MPTNKYCTNCARPFDKFKACAGTFKFLVKKWNREVFGDVEERKSKLLNDLNDIQDKLMANQNVASNLVLEAKIREDLSKVLREEETMWAQKAKVKWLQLKDQNTKYFQTVATTRKK